MNTGSSIASTAKMPAAKRRPRLWLRVVGIALPLLLLPLLLGLGFWQLERAAEKRQLEANWQARSALPAQTLVSLEGQRDLAYRRVQLQGRFDGEHTLLLDNRVRDGHPGVEVLQPFYDQRSGLWLLVNRGWQRWQDRRELPRVHTPEAQLNLTAWVYQSHETPLQLGAAPSQGWPRLVTEANPQALWQRLERAGFAYEVRLTPGPAALDTRWPPVNMSPAKHTAYAWQWFALALALLCLSAWQVVVSYRGARHAAR